MPPRRPARPTPPDVEALRAALGQGKIVRVGIAPSGQFPDGVTGRVRRIGDPAVDGEEFLFVEVPVGGTKDVLPFAAKDLTSAPARRAAGAALLAATSAPVRSAPPTAPPPRDQAVIEPLPPTKPAGPGAPARPARSKTTATGGRGKRAPVSITISTAGDESAAWRIEARIGAKVAVRPTVVPPSRVWEIVQTLGEPRLTDVVQTLLEDHRRSTQARADALAAELAGLRAELNSFPAKDA